MPVSSISIVDKRLTQTKGKDWNHHRRRSILAQWDAVTDEAAHAPVASYEAEAAPRGPGAALRGTAPARLTQCTLSGASPGVTYQVGC